MALQMLVRNRVEDYTKWRKVFDADTDRGTEAGLSVASVWRVQGDANNVFFLLNVEDEQKAEAFLNSPASANSGENSGVIDGEVYWVNPV